MNAKSDNSPIYYVLRKPCNTCAHGSRLLHTLKECPSGGPKIDGCSDWVETKGLIIYDEKAE